MLRGTGETSGMESKQARLPPPPRQEQQQQRQQPRLRRNQERVPIYTDKDAAQRPFEPDQFYKGSELYEARPSNISYFPNQVLHISYQVSLLMEHSGISRSNTNSTSNAVLELQNDQYLTDLTNALDALGTELAPLSYPTLWVREITTSIDAWVTTGKLQRVVESTVAVQLPCPVD
jgi:hypothetical protein